MNDAPGPPRGADPSNSPPPDQSYAGPANPGQPYPGQPYAGQPYSGPAYGGGPQGGWAVSPAPKPGVIPLRPLGLGEILDGAVSYIRANPKVTLGLSAVVMTITELIQLPLQYLYIGRLASITGDRSTAPSPKDMLAAFTDGFSGLLVGSLISFLAVTALTGLLMVVLARAVMGQRPTWAEAWGATRGRLLGLLGLTLLTSLILVAVFAVGVAPVVVAAVLHAPTGLTVLLGLFVLVGLCAMTFLWVSLSMVTPAYVLEDITVRAAFGRSMRLVRPAWGRVFGIQLLAVVIGGIISGVIALPFSLASVVVGGDFGNAFSGHPTGFVSTSLLALAVTAVGTILAATVTAPFRAGVTGLLYFDQRMRREALDLELLGRAGAESGGQAPDSDTGSPRPAW